MKTNSARSWWKNAIWLFVFMTACAPQAGTAPAEAVPQEEAVSHEVTMTEALSAWGLTADDNLCLDPSNPKMRGADCMARDESGKVLLPYQSVGCIIDGQQVGRPSMKASISQMGYVPCTKPLYDMAAIFIDESTIMAAASYFGPGTYAGIDETTGFREKIWFEKDDYFILIHRLYVQVLGCARSMEGWIPSSIPQYEANGLPPVTNPESVNYRVYISTVGANGEVWYTWISGVNLTGTDANGLVDGFRPVCETFPTQ